MLVKNTTKETLDPVLMGDHRLCFEPGEEIDLDEELAKEVIKEYKGLKIVEDDKEEEDEMEEMTKDEIKEELDEMDVEYPARATKTELQKILEEAKSK